MRKSSDRNRNYRKTSFTQAELVASFRKQMADFARGERLVQLREAKHLTQDEAAHQIGVSEKSLRAWEKGGKIRAENVRRVGAFYEVDPNELVDRESLDDDGNGGFTQLDRIEAKLDRLLAAFEDELGGLADELRQDGPLPG